MNAADEGECGGGADWVDEPLASRIRAIKLIAFDFDGVFTDNTVWVFADGSEAVRGSRADGIGLRTLERLGIAAVLISSEPHPIVGVRARKLGIRCIQDCANKIRTLTDLAHASGAAMNEVAFVGNDVNDRDCLRAVGLPIVVADAHPDVIALGRYRTRARGGRGAVREICDLFETVRGAGAHADENATATGAVSVVSGIAVMAIAAEASSDIDRM